MGDLTSYGTLDGFQSCAEYIAKSLQIGQHGVFHSIPVGVLPGNHDVNRDLAKNPALVAKFLPLRDALARVGLSNMPIQDPIWIKLQSGKSSASIALLNSSWGCGAQEFIPEEFRGGVASAIDEAISSGNSEKATREYYERQFDTPAFSTNVLQAIAARHLGSDFLIVSAHHNLLPQRQPRLAPYTELVNSGALRSTLQELDRPVLYLHGHIHDDPVEILNRPGTPPVVMISAPLITDGYNIVEVISNANGLPISCAIRKWRYSNSGVIREVETMRVALLGNRRRSSSKTLPNLYSVLLKSREIYWLDALREAESIYSLDVKNQLIEELELLATDGHIQIENLDLDPEHWIIGATL